MKYAAQIEIHRADGRREAITLDENELLADRAVVKTATGFYSGFGSTLIDVERLGVFAAAALLDAGDEAIVTYTRERANGTVEETARRNRARRDSVGAFATTLGSRFNERYFRGV